MSLPIGSTPDVGTADPLIVSDGLLTELADIVDFDTVQELADLGGEEEPELFNDLVELYLSDAPARFDAMRVGASEKDFEALESVAHAIKSASINLGARVVAELAGSIERNARSGLVNPQAVATCCEEHERFARLARQLLVAEHLEQFLARAAP